MKYNGNSKWNNTPFLFHFQMHLFDIDVKGGVRFKESDVLTGGSEFTTFHLDNNFKIGVGICYDIRFEEMARLYRNDGMCVRTYTIFCILSVNLLFIRFFFFSPLFPFFLFGFMFWLKGCDMLIYPAAFNMTTGPLHWELLQRARANDLQLYVASISPARDPNFEYVAWGHSMVVDPWGKVVITAKESEEIIYADIGMCILMMQNTKCFYFCFGFFFVVV